MTMSRSARWWASLLILVVLLVNAGVPAAGARANDPFIGEVCSASVSAVGERDGTPAGHPVDGSATPHCAACPTGLAALLEPFPAAKSFVVTTAAFRLACLAESIGHARQRPRADAPPRAPPVLFVA